MIHLVKSRTYDNRLREEQAAATRQRIIDAVIELLVEDHPSKLAT